MIIAIPLREADSIGGLTAGNNNVLDSQLTGRLDYIVGTQHVPLEALIVRYQHVPCVCREMYDRIDRADGHCV